MNAHLFDSMTRRLASRRTALRAGGMGLAAAVAAPLARVDVQEAPPAAFPRADEDIDAAMLFVLTAGPTTLEPGDDGFLMLRPTETEAQTLYFSDRPARIVGTTPTLAFTSLSEAQFEDAYPNAALIGHPEAGSEEEEVLVVELMAADYRPVSRTLTYRARLLDAESVAGRDFRQEPLATVDTPREYAEAHLFIDTSAYCAACFANPTFVGQTCYLTCCMNHPNKKQCPG